MFTKYANKMMSLITTTRIPLLQNIFLVHSLHFKIFMNICSVVFT